MPIGVISDTHDNLKNLDKALRTLAERGIDLLIHLGDWVSPYSVGFASMLARDLGIEIRSIFGNNEGDIGMILRMNESKGWGVKFSETDTMPIEAGGRRIIAYHGTDERITEALLRSGLYDAVFTGHTHRRMKEVVNGILHLNPGTLSGAVGPRIVEEASVALYYEAENDAELILL